MVIGKNKFDEGHTYIMGILNATPDSFSDGGKFNSVDKALKHIEQMISDGADVIDIGGESTRPGYEHISVLEEIERVAPIIEQASRHFDIPISIDTYKPEVAREAILKGAALVNDIWGFRGENLIVQESGMSKIVAESGVACCIMQNLVLDSLNSNDNYVELYSGKSTEDDISSLGLASIRVINGLNECIKIAEAAGISRDKILLDPGIGFGKTYQDNIEVLVNLKRIKDFFEYPMLLGASRKSVVGLTLNLPSDERIEGTLATTAKAVEAGCLFVRVHDVKENARFIKMYEAIR